MQKLEQSNVWVGYHYKNSWLCNKGVVVLVTSMNHNHKIKK